MRSSTSSRGDLLTDALGEALLPRVQWTPPDLPGRNDSWRDGPACISMNASIDDGSSSTRRRIPSATSSETSSAQCSAVLNATTRTGSLYWPDIKSVMTVSRSARSTSVSVRRCQGARSYCRQDKWFDRRRLRSAQSISRHRQYPTDATPEI